MLSAKRLPEVLRTALDDGVLGACLMTLDGSVLCSVVDKSNSDSISETSLAAISSSIMNNYLQGGACEYLFLLFDYLFSLYSFQLLVGNTDVSFTVIKFEHGCLAVSTAGKGYLIAAYGKNVALGLLRGRLMTLGQYFSRVFEQVK